MSLLPYTILSSAVSVDGYLDDASPDRLILSSPEDFDRVDALRSTCDAILVGAQTIRSDNPGLSIRNPERREQRLRVGKPAELVKVTLTRSANLSPAHKFFSPTDNDILVYCPTPIQDELSKLLDHRAVVVPEGDCDVDLQGLLEDLKQRGVERLLIEGGQTIATSFLARNLIHELQIAIAPFFVGDHKAPRFVHPATFPYNKNRRMKLASSTTAGDMIVITYLLTHG